MSDAAALTAVYALWALLGSMLIAAFANYVALDLSKRVRTTDHRVALSWGIGGSLAMGLSIWAMPFVGMLAFSAADVSRPTAGPV